MNGGFSAGMTDKRGKGEGGVGGVLSQVSKARPEAPNLVEELVSPVAESEGDGLGHGGSEEELPGWALRRGSHGRS
jgi:hypothetical protein